MKTIIIAIVLFLILTFLYLFSVRKIMLSNNTKNKNTSETLKNKSERCPNVLVKKNNVLLLYNDINNNNELPVQFNNLDEYINHVQTQRKNGKDCPVLFLQQENNTQGNDVYRIRSDPLNQQGGMQPLSVVAPVIDSNLKNPPYNKGNYNGFDPYGLQVGVYNDLDKIHNSTALSKISDNPLDPNWGGVEYTQTAVDMGKYKENEVTKPIYYTPKNVQFFPNLQNSMKPPINYTDELV